MTKKHFKELAAIVAELPASCRWLAAKRIADLCETCNMSFDRSKFLKACGV